MSTWMWENPLPGYRDRLQGGRRLPGYLGPGAGLAVLHPLRQFFVHARPCHSLAHDPPCRLRAGCAIPWKASKTLRRWPTGITGHRWRSLVSHNNLTVLKGTSWRVRLESPAAWLDGQSRWASAMAAYFSVWGWPPPRRRLFLLVAGATVCRPPCCPARRCAGCPL